MIRGRVKGLGRSEEEEWDWRIGEEEWGKEWGRDGGGVGEEWRLP